MILLAALFYCVICFVAIRVLDVSELDHYTPLQDRAGVSTAISPFIALGCIGVDFLFDFV